MYQFVHRFASPLIAACVLLGCSPASAQDVWESLTSFGTVRQFLPISDTVYVVTSGGLMRIVDPNQEVRRFTNLDGLGTVNLYAMIRDNNAIDWLAASGRVIRRDKNSVRQIPLLDLDNQLFDAFCLADDGNRLWVGTAIGLVVIDKISNGGQLAEFYDHFADLNTGAAVNDIALTGESIWIATNSGLAVARRNDLIALNAPSNWTGWNVVDYPALGTDTIRKIELYRDSLYVATSRGAFTFDRSVFPPTLQQNVATANQAISDLVSANDSLFLVSQTDAVLIIPGQTLILAPNRPLRTMTSTNLRRWFNGLDGTIIYQDAGGNHQFDEIELPSNAVADIAFASTGGPSVVHAILTNGGVVRHENGRWVTLFDPPGWTGNNIVSTGSSLVFASLEGGGIVDVNGDQVVRYDTTGTTLRGVSEGPNFIPVRDLAFDNGILFAACYRAFNNYPVSIVRSGTLESRLAWDSIGASEGIFDNFVISIAVHGNFLAVGTEANGIFVCNMGPDPFDNSDDDCTHFTEISGNLISNAVRVVRFSPDGELWIGTNFGLSRLDPSIETRCTDVNLPDGFGPDLSDLEFDSQGVLWMGAANGIARLDIQHASFSIYTTADSPLLSDQIRSLSIDPLTNDLFISTPSGISVLRSGAGELTDDYSRLLASPNPFVVDGSEVRLHFNARNPGELSIFTASGDLVFSSSILEWDGRNSSGQLVASGVYLFTISDESGQSGRGKFLLVRQ